MYDAATLVWLIVQAACAISGVAIWSTTIAGRLDDMNRPTLAVEVWGPLVVVGPMLAAVALVEGDVRDGGWSAISGPVLAAVVGIGTVVLFSTNRNENASRRPSVIHTASAIGTELLLLLLGAAHVLSVWVGQCVFAIAAILLWINMPAAPKSRDELNAADNAVGGALFVVLLLAILHVVAALQAMDAAPVFVAAISLAYACAALITVACRSSHATALRLSFWCGAFGVLFGVGLMSLTSMIPNAVAAIAGTQTASFDPRPGMQVAYGFGGLAPEAVLWIFAVGAVVVFHRVETKTLHRIVGAALCILTIAIVAFRYVA